MKLKPVLVIAALGTMLLVGLLILLRRDQSLTRLQQEGTIRIGYSLEEPYAYLQPTGEVTGEFPEAAKQIVAQLGIARIEWVQTDFDNLIPDLEEGRFDVVAAGMFITKERAQHADFSNPLLRVQQSLLVRAGNPRQLHAYEDALTNGAIKIAVIKDAVEEHMLRRIGLREKQIVTVPDARTGRIAVETGIADGLALTSPTIRSMATRDDLGATEIAQPFRQPDASITKGIGYCAFVFRQSDDQLRSMWNTVMTSFVDNEKHRMLLERFGFTTEELPGSVTADEVLSR